MLTWDKIPIANQQMQGMLRLSASHSNRYTLNDLCELQAISLPLSSIIARLIDHQAGQPRLGLKAIQSVS